MIVSVPRLEIWPDATPPHWEWTPVSAATELVSDGGRHVKASDYEIAGPVPVIDQGQHFIAGYTHDAAAAVADVPLVIFGDHTRRVKLVDFPFAVGAQGVKLLRARSGWDLRFLAYVLAACPLEAKGYSRHWSHLRKVIIPRPPIHEQTSIADWLDKSISRLERAGVNLRTATSKTATLRSSILVQAWKASVAAAESVLGNSAKSGWRTITDIIGVGGVFRDGDWVESKDQDAAGEVRLTQLADIGVGRWVDRSDRWLTRDAAHQLGCTYLEAGDLLVARMADPLARACIFPGAPSPCVTAVDVCIVRGPSDVVSRRWLMWLLNSPQFKADVERAASGSTRKRISRRNLGAIPLPTPQLETQLQIAEAVDRAVSLLDDAESEIVNAHKRATLLSTAITQIALSGSHVSV